MRPIDKGLSPKVYSQYQDAGPDLIDRIGDYCSYCERQIETNLAVEHIKPKKYNPELRNDWSNFLLGCVNCNSCKGSEDINIDDYFWPDKDNTMMTFDYVIDGKVIPHPALDDPNKNIALSTISLVGLDREPGHLDANKNPTDVDRRWRKRQEAWDLAQRDLARLNRNDTNDIRELIVENALARGMFSIWMKAFEDDQDMRQRLIYAFKGTAKNCFETTTTATIPRAGGRP